MIQIYRPTNKDYDKNGDMTLFPTVCQINTDQWEMTLHHPIDDEGRWQYIVNGAVIKAPSFNGEQLFRIVNKFKNDSGVEATARPIFFDSAKEVMLEDVRLTHKNGQEALDIMMNGTKFSGNSDIIKYSAAYYDFKNLMEALTGDHENSFINRWGGEVLYDNYTIHINEHLGKDNGVKVSYGKNLIVDGISEEIDDANVVTRIYPKAYGGYRMSGTAYVDSPIASDYAPSVRQKVIDFTDVKMRADATDDDAENGVIICDTQDELDLALKRKCDELFAGGIDRPDVSINADMTLLQNTIDYEGYKDLESISLGDVIHCEHYKLGIVTSAKVVSLVYNCLLDRVENVVIGQAFDNYIKETSGNINAIGNVIDKSTSTLMADRIVGVINMLHTSLYAQKGIAQKQDVRAILFEDLDPDSPTFGALCIGTQGIQISKQRTADRSDWKWGTAVNFESVVADYILTGLLSDKLGNNFWNLDTGEFVTKNMKAMNADISGVLNSNSGSIAGFSLGPDGFTKTARFQFPKRYTEDDLIRIREIVMGNIIPTDEDYRLYDLNSDGKISSADYVMVKNVLLELVDDVLFSKIKINVDAFSYNDVRQPVITIEYSDGEGNTVYKTSISVRSIESPSVITRSVTLDEMSANDEQIRCNSDIDMQNHKLLNQSDERCKENIDDIDLSEIFDAAKVYGFHYQNDPDRQTGVIAQDFVGKKHADLVLKKDKDGYYLVNYHVILMALLQRVKELEKIVKGSDAHDSD